MGSMLLFGLIGFLDDYLKIKKHRSLGLIVRKKLFFQFLCAGVFALVIVLIGFARGPVNGFDLKLYVPVFKLWTPLLGWFYIPWIMFILVGSSNAVNLADGLDGLAIGLTLISATTLTALTYVAGHRVFSQYLNIGRVPQAAELTVFAGALTGACLGFLWFNAHPAEVFMGDVGALSLGGTLGMIAILIKQEFLLFRSPASSSSSSLSVVLQVGYFRLSGGSASSAWPPSTTISSSSAGRRRGSSSGSGSWASSSPSSAWRP